MTYPLATLEAIFRAEDIEGFIALGCPEDEYDSEASLVQNQLQNLEESEFSQARVSPIVTAVWQRTFGPFDNEDWRKRMPVLQSLVQHIVENRPVKTTPPLVQQSSHKQDSLERFDHSR